MLIKESPTAKENFLVTSEPKEPKEPKSILGLEPNRQSTTALPLLLNEYSALINGLLIRVLVVSPGLSNIASFLDLMGFGCTILNYCSSKDYHFS